MQKKPLEDCLTKQLELKNLYLEIQMQLICRAPSQLSTRILLQLFAADHRERHSEGRRAVGVTSMSEPEKEEDGAAAGKPDSRRRSRFLSWRTSHRPIRYDGRLGQRSSSSSSLAGDDCVWKPTTVWLCDTESDVLFVPHASPVGWI